MNNSPVIEVMRQATASTWRAWRRHLAAGTSESPEGMAAFEAMQLASAAFAGERADRHALTDLLSTARRNAAVNDRGPAADLGLVAAIQQAAEAA